jgi:alginate O-acetyltransferase complex protein AlgI
MRARVKLPDVLIQSIPPIVTMFVSGLWHGAGLTFIVWGLYYGVLISAYQLIGIRGDWKPKSAWRTGLAWLVMFSFIVFGWAIFRAPSLDWLGQALFHTSFIKERSDVIVGLIALSTAFIYSLPLWIKLLLDHFAPKEGWLQAGFHAVAAAVVILFLNSSAPDFIYFQF